MACCGDIKELPLPYDPTGGSVPPRIPPGRAILTFSEHIVSTVFLAVSLYFQVATFSCIDAILLLIMLRRKNLYYTVWR